MRRKRHVLDAHGAAHVEYTEEPDPPDPLEGLAFTPAARAKADRWGHTADLYEGIEPEGFGGEFLVEQVEAVEAAREES